jgi:5-methylcytosine-specific restriction endonuclease McrA
MTNRKGVDMKQCSKCFETKPFTDFYKNNKVKDGLYAYCKPCSKEVAKNNYLKNPEKHIAYTKSWKKDNPEKVNAQNRRRNKKYPEKLLEQTRRYRSKNPEVVANQNHRRRDRKINNGSFVIRKSFMRKLYESQCWYCGSNKNIQADHVVPLARGGRHSEGNLMPLCRSCNLSKRDKTITEWRLVN